MHLICEATQTKYPIDAPIWCSEAGALLDIDFRPSIDWDWVKHLPPNLWRYKAAFPLSNEAPIVSFGEGFTPLQKISFGKQWAWVKLDYLFPSGSYKDRGASVMMSHIKSLGIKEVVQDSSGNAGASVAQYAALAGIKCKIFLPENTSPAKIKQMQHCGAEVIKVAGTREDTAQAALLAAQDTYYASHVWNPFFFQGTKTFAYEIVEQLNFKAPHTLVLPAGNGTLLLGAYLGFKELQQSGIIKAIPKLVGIQAAHCAPLSQAFAQAQDNVESIDTQPTIAEGIAIAQPKRAPQMLDFVRKTNGLFINVEEENIKETWHALAQRGYYVEPTSAAVIAGLQQYLTQHAQPDEVVASVLTGHGLKKTL